MSIIKYKATFKRILTVMVKDGAGVKPMRVGEVTKFKQNEDGSLDLVVWIWPQTPQGLREKIEKNPQILGMTGEAQPVFDHLIFQDGTEVP